MADSATITVFKQFAHPFTTANAKRSEGDFFSLDSPSMRRDARLLYTAQIICSIVAPIVLLLVSFYDLLQCKWSGKELAITAGTHLFIILPLSILGAILPMSWSLAIDRSISDYTQKKRIATLQLDCYDYMRSQSNPDAHTIEQSDLVIAIGKKRVALVEESKQKSAEALRTALAQAEEGSPEQSDLYHMLDICKVAEQKAIANKSVQAIKDLIAQAAPDSPDYHNTCDGLSYKYATGNLTIPQLRALLNMGRQYLALPAEEQAAFVDGFENEPAEIQAAALDARELVCQTAIAKAIAHKYQMRNTTQGLIDLLPQLPPEEAPEAVAATVKKASHIGRLARCETLEALIQGRAAFVDVNPQRHDEFVRAIEIKETRLQELVGTLTLETAREQLKQSRNPVKTSDLSEVIRRMYCNTYCFNDLASLLKQSPDDVLLKNAIDRKDGAINKETQEKTLDQLLAPAEGESSNQQKDRLEMVQRKYILANTLDELIALKTAHPENLDIQKACERKHQIIQNLKNTLTLDALMQRHNSTPNPGKKAELLSAINAKRAEIAVLCQEQTRGHLTREKENAKNSEVKRSDYRHALAQKDESIKQFTAQKTFGELLAMHSDPIYAPVGKNDLEECIRHKEKILVSLIKNNTSEALWAQHGAAPVGPAGNVQSNNLSIAITHKADQQTLANTETLNQLKARVAGKAKLSLLDQARVEGALQLKSDHIRALVAASSLEALQDQWNANQASMPVIARDDLSMAILVKTAEAAAAAKAAASAAQAVPAGT